MANQKEYPIRFTARGICDAFDATDIFPGACLSLQNLIFDQSNPEQMIARPGVGSPLTSFASFTSPTFIAVHTAIGNMVYGMISTGRNSGFDEPFAYNITTGLFVTISGVTGANVPTSLSTSGDWTPPTIAIVGVKIIITHAGFSGTGNNFLGVIDITNPLAPAWSSSNTATNALPSVPTSVSNFNNRAYYACGNVLYYSDVLVPLKMTNSGQALTVGDTTPILAQSGLPIQTSTAGVVGALLIFKAFQIWQVTGDAAVTGSLSQNYLSLNVGCASPRSIVQTPAGMLFIAIDGPYYVSALGQVLPLTKDANKLVQDLQEPFQNVVNPTRASAGYSGSIYRICLDTIVDGQSTTNDYWFDVTVRRWCGPHTFPYDEISQVGNYFVHSSRYNGAMLFASPILASAASVYNDNGTPLSILMQTCLFPKTQNINVKQVIESNIELNSAASTIDYTITAVDQGFNAMASAQIVLTSTAPTWGGGGLWGGGLVWTAGAVSPIINTIPWSNPLVFKKMGLQINATASYNLAIGTFYCKYRDAGYLNF